MSGGEGHALVKEYTSSHGQYGAALELQIRQTLPVQHKDKLRPSQLLPKPLTFYQKEHRHTVLSSLLEPPLAE